jgi:hypothetical protein
VDLRGQSLKESRDAGSTGLATLARHMSATAEIYVSTDVEADGPIPGPHSMLSFGSVAMWGDGTVVAEFAANLGTLPGAAPHPTTQAWWAQHPEAFALSRVAPESPEVVMPRYAAWLEQLPARPVFVGHPAAWDFAWIYWYLVRFHGFSPFGHSGLDTKSFAMALLKKPYRDCIKHNFPAEWHPKGHWHTHVALDDAREQGLMFCAMLAAARA